MFLRLLAVRLSTSCVSKVLAGKPQKHDILTSCGGLRVLTAQELLAALLARALFLGCTVDIESDGDQDRDSLGYYKCRNHDCPHVSTTNATRNRYGCYVKVKIPRVIILK